MEKTHQCPLCGDVAADPVTEQELLVHKGESFRIQHTFYRCPVCDLEFDTDGDTERCIKSGTHNNQIVIN